MRIEAASRFDATPRDLRGKKLTVRRKRWIKASLLTMIAATPVVPMLAVVNPASAAVDANAISQLVKTITSDPLSARREDAAIQLVNRPDSLDQIDAILKNPGNPLAQVAVAKALAKSVNPNPALIGDLEKLLGPPAPNPEMAEAAAGALAAMSFEQHREVFNVLKAFADDPRNADNVRAKVIWSMGAVVQLPVADYLIGVINAPNQNAVISNAAMDALADLSGISSYGNNAGQWQQWWGGLRAKTAVEFRSTVLETRDQQFKLFKQHDAQLWQAAGAHLRDNYNALLILDSAAASKTLLSYLQDHNTPEIRDLGVTLIEIDPPNRFKGAVREELLKMIDDPDDKVRSSVIGVFQIVNAHDARDPLIKQLEVEKNLQIRIAIIHALGKLEDLAAVTSLVGLLHDPQPEIVIAAASAIADLGAKLRENDPHNADLAAVQLRAIVDPGAPARVGNDVVAACLKALAALRDKESFKIFEQLVMPAEPSEVRQAALLGFGSLADTNADQIVADQLDDGDPAVRAAAAVALQTTATPIFTDRILRKMKDDSSQKVKDALWVALQNLYPKESINDLNRIAGELTDDPDKRLVTLQKLGDALATAGNLQGVAENQQVIADAMMAVKPPNTLEAIKNLQDALKFWRGPGNRDRDRQEAIVDALLDDELAAKQWTDAAKFAADQIRIDPVYQTTVGPKIKSRIELLASGDATTNTPADPASASELIDEALKMDPPLDAKYRGQIQDIQNTMKAVHPPG